MIKRGKFTRSEREKAGISGVKEAFWTKIEDANAHLDMMTVCRYYESVAKDEGVTYEDAMQMCVDVPKYSLGLKMASPAIIFMLRSKRGKEVFEGWLTDEEKEEWAKVKDMNFRKLIKTEKKRQKAD